MGGGSYMKNVVINKLEKYIFTEDQLKGHLKKHDKDITFDSLTTQQIMSLAKKLLNEASHSELEQHLMSSPWRSSADWTGKMIDDDDSDSSMHIELIDTDLKSNSRAETIIDRLISFTCNSCCFHFYVELGSNELSHLKCPICSKAVEGDKGEELKHVRKED
jgi:hypothetical protein